jgi:hypothetical protein
MEYASIHIQKKFWRDVKKCVKIIVVMEYIN